MNKLISGGLVSVEGNKLVVTQATVIIDDYIQRVPADIFEIPENKAVRIGYNINDDKIGLYQKTDGKPMDVLTATAYRIKGDIHLSLNKFIMTPKSVRNIERAINGE